MNLLLIRNYNNKKYLWFLLFILTFFFSLLHACHSANQKNVENLFKKGIYIYKKANCSSCHLWHADGGNSHGGAAASLRNTNLSYQELFTVIKCGRLGTNMPYFLRFAEKDIDCTHFKYEAYRSKEALVLKGAKLLSETEIVFLSKFIYEEIKNKPITKRYCFAFFNKEEVCNRYTK